MITKGLPFQFKGVVDVSDCKKLRDVIIKAGLNFHVEKYPIFGHKDNIIAECPNYFATVRTDKNIGLGIVKDKYTIVQNISAFNFFDSAIGKNKASWYNAGCFGNGERIFVSAKLPYPLFIKGDLIDHYLVFTTTHDGTGTVKILLTSIRVVCENTLNAAIKNNQAMIPFKHTNSIHDKIRIADKILNINKNKVKFLKEQYELMESIKVGDDKMVEFISKTILSTKDIDNIYITNHTYKEILNKNYDALVDTGITTNKANVIQSIVNYYHTNETQTNIKGTAWGVYNAVSGYYSNIANLKDEKRMDALLYGEASKKILKSNEIITN